MEFLCRVAWSPRVAGTGFRGWVAAAMTARPRGQRSFAMWVMLAAAVMGGCGAEPTSPGRGTPSASSYFMVPRVQPNSALKPGVEDRIERALIGPAIPVKGAAAVPLSTEWMDDIVTSVCGNRAGEGVNQSRFGRRREWTGPGLSIRHFVGAFGAVTAAQAVEQPRARLGCGTYNDRDGKHRLLGEVILPEYPNINGRLMFCEVVDEDVPAETLSRFQPRRGRRSRVDVGGVSIIHIRRGSR